MPNSAKNFADRLLEAPRSFADRTSISGAIEFAMAHLARAPFDLARHTIDVSGDGTNNSGREVTQARDAAVAQGVTINGLVILSETPLAWNPDHTNPAGGLENYYRNNVIGGPGAFVMAAQGFNSFGQSHRQENDRRGSSSRSGAAAGRWPVERPARTQSVALVPAPAGTVAAQTRPVEFVVLRQPFGRRRGESGHERDTEPGHVAVHLPIRLFDRRERTLERIP